MPWLHLASKDGIVEIEENMMAMAWVKRSFAGHMSYSEAINLKSRSTWEGGLTSDSVYSKTPKNGQ